MKKHVLFVGFLLIGCSVFAQNKTLGVGVATPNPNAALHVESPTGNQGFILPRLTTAQRTATGFTSVLAAADNGLIVYDTDLKGIYVWDGAKWTNSEEDGAKLNYPYVDTIATAPNNSNLLRLLYVGSATENVGVAHFENLNPNNGFSAIFGRTNSVTNGVADFVVNNAANNNDAIGVITNGIGRAGSFSVINASNQNAAIYATTNGTVGATASNSAAILGETNTAFSAVTGRVATGFSNGVSGLSASPETGSFAVLGTNSGGGQAGVFNITSATNSQTAVEVSTMGTGGAGKFVVNNVNSTFPALWAQTNSNQALSAPIYGLNTGTGDVAASFRINNAASTFPAVYAESNGTGRTATFRKLGTTGASPAVFVSSEGGHGIWADHNGTTGYAAIIQNINVANNSAAMFVEAVGGGASIWAQKSAPESIGDAIMADHAGANGRVAFFQHLNATTNSPVLQATTAGIGTAGTFEITNSSSSSPAVYAQTSGPGSGISADNTGTGDAMAAIKTGSSGSAGNFQINNGANTASALFALTNAGNGSSIGAINSGNGNALAIFSGGVRLSTASISASPITTRAAAYLITSGATSFSFDPSVTMNEGDTFYFFNSTGVSVTVGGATITASTGRTFIYLGGALRAF
jgi:hypothetical protein